MPTATAGARSRSTPWVGLRSRDRARAAGHRTGPALARLFPWGIPLRVQHIGQTRRLKPIPPRLIGSPSPTRGPYARAHEHLDAHRAQPRSLRACATCRPATMATACQLLVIVPEMPRCCSLVTVRLADCLRALRTTTSATALALTALEHRARSMSTACLVENSAASRFGCASSIAPISVSPPAGERTFGLVGHPTTELGSRLSARRGRRSRDPRNALAHDPSATCTPVWTVGGASPRWPWWSRRRGREHHRVGVLLDGPRAL